MDALSHLGTEASLGCAATQQHGLRQVLPWKASCQHQSSRKKTGVGSVVGNGSGGALRHTGGSSEERCSPTYAGVSEPAPRNDCSQMH